MSNIAPKKISVDDLRVGDYVKGSFPHNRANIYPGSRSEWNCCVVDIEGDYVKVKRHTPKARPQWLHKKYVGDAWRYNYETTVPPADRR